MQIQFQCPTLNVKQCVKTRWNLTFHMLARVLEIKPSLTSLIAIEYAALENLTSNEIELMYNCCKILEVFKDVTKEISSEKAVTPSKINLIIDALTNWCNEWLQKKDLPHQVVGKMADHTNMHCSSHATYPQKPCCLWTPPSRSLHRPDVNFSYGKILEGLEKRFEEIGDNPLLAESTFLEPRFLKYGFSNPEAYERCKKRIISKIRDSRKQNVLTSRTTLNASKIWEKFDSFVAGIQQNREVTSGGSIQVNKYVNEPLLSRSCDPLKRSRSIVYCWIISAQRKNYSKASQIMDGVKSKLLHAQEESQFLRKEELVQGVLYPVERLEKLEIIATDVEFMVSDEINLTDRDRSCFDVHYEGDTSQTAGERCLPKEKRLGGRKKI
ncbi:hypothetical protein J437_LFUL015862 [Ladona fulva]|uniref:Uncharacterized protein n=1 Tax=Ladona fulva TaxID=123851 RepID=A0A8K0P7Y3_LADFU|nr:hypothetical protein J437_LFUL015862 [Ladona fulva]